MFIDEGIGMLSLTRHKIIDKPFLFSCDGTNKGMHHVIKMISFWCIDRVLEFLLDSNATIGENINNDDTTNISLKKSIIVMETA